MSTEALTTAAAFERLLERTDQWRKTGRPMAQRFNFRNKLRKGKRVSLDTKEKILTEAVYTVKQETTWRFPDGFVPKKKILTSAKK
jgi:hypothetical protein